MIAMVLMSCSKDDGHHPQNIRLYDKPLSVIRSHIEGNWKLHYTKGGIAANNIQYWEDAYWKFVFSDKDSIKTTGGPIAADTNINWISGHNNYVGETYLMNFYSNYFVVDSIYHDTLVIHNNVSDAAFYHFTKQ